MNHTGFCSDVTFTTDWALKTSYLSVLKLRHLSSLDTSNEQCCPSLQTVCIVCVGVLFVLFSTFSHRVGTL